MGTIVVLGLILAAVILAVRKIMRDRKNGNCCSSCGGSCHCGEKCNKTGNGT